MLMLWYADSSFCLVKCLLNLVEKDEGEFIAALFLFRALIIPSFCFTPSPQSTSAVRVYFETDCSQSFVFFVNGQMWLLHQK